MAEVKLLKTTGQSLAQQSSTDSISVASIGLGVASPANGITNSGQVTQNVRMVTSSYSVAANDYFIGLGSISGSVTITLPLNPNTGRVIVIKDTTGLLSLLNILTINGNGKNIDGGASVLFTLALTKITLIYNGTQWSSI